MTQASSSNKGQSRGDWVGRISFIGLLVTLVVAGGFLLGSWCSGRPLSLSEEVVNHPKKGIVVSRNDHQVCLVLVRDEGDTDNRKSCTDADGVINLGHSRYGQPAVNPKVGDFYTVHHLEDSGGSYGLLFVPPDNQ